MVASQRRAGNKTLIKFTGLDLRRLPEAIAPEALALANNVDLTIGGGISSRDQLAPYATVDPASVGLYTLGNTLRTAVPFRLSSAIPVQPLGIKYDIFGPSDTDAADPALNYRVSAVTQWDGRPYLCIAQDAVSGVTGKGRRYVHHYFDVDPITFAGTATNGSATVTLTRALTRAIPSGTTVWFQGRPEAYTCSVSGTTMTLNTPYLGTTTLTGQALGVLQAPVKTSVETPFTPGPALIGAAEKLWAGESLSGDTWFSSSINGPRDWTNDGDAGFLPTSRYSGGDQHLQAFGIFNGKLIVFYETTVQSWVVDADPANHELSGVVGGAGTNQPGSVANVMGDVFYYAQGGFRSLKSVVTTGQLNDGDVGAPVMPETRRLPLNTAPAPVSIWSPGRAQYMCGVNNTMYVFTYSPVSGVTGWTKYQLPGTLEAMCELEGVTYCRFIGDNVIYKFDHAYQGEPGFSWTARFAFYDGEDHTIPKFWRIFDYAVSAPVSLTYYTVPGNDAAKTATVALDPAAIVTRSYPMQICNHLAAEFTGTTKCTIDRFTYRFDMGNL